MYDQLKLSKSLEIWDQFELAYMIDYNDPWIQKFKSVRLIQIMIGFCHIFVTTMLVITARIN